MYGRMAGVMKESGIIIICMGKGFINGRMADQIMDLI